MDIFKAIKKERNFTKRFYIIMLLIAVVLALAVYLTGLNSFFYLIYLIIIEFLIFVAVINKINFSKITYGCNNNRLKFQCGLLAKESLIFCDKVVLVHTEKMEEDMEIVVVTSVNFKNRGLKPAIAGFEKKYKTAAKELYKIKKAHEEKIYYYQVIKRGGLRKYLLLDCIYKNCVKAIYTDDCIQNIKIARGQTLV